MADKRVTKVEIFTEIRDALMAMGPDYADLADFTQGEIDGLVAKAAKAKEKAAEKRTEADDLKVAVASALTDELQTGAAIFAAVDDSGDEDWATLGKVRARLTSLVKDGIAVKEEVKVEDKTAMAYRLA